MSLSTNMLTLIETVSETVKQSLTSFVETKLESNAEEFNGSMSGGRGANEVL